jgi:2-dehydro-3-deoxyphosphogluconate aldolase/(4S)-4-hydroxy-2-oxoglutarate aldolase
MAPERVGHEELSPRAATVLGAVRAQGVVAVVRSADAATARATATALLDAGLGAVEVSLTTPGALDVVAALTGEERTVGVGTVTSVAQYRDAVAAGAAFVVSPTLDVEVVRHARRDGVLAVPGTSTPTEGLAAVLAGAPLVKLFPASLWSPKALRDVLAALPDLPLVPTGGIGLDDVPTWWSHGAVAVGLGSRLSRGGPEDVSARVARLLAQRAT